MYSPPAIKYRVPSNQDIKRSLHTFKLGYSNNLKTLIREQRHVTKMFDCCPSKLDRERTLDFCQSSNTFYGIPVFSNIIGHGNDLGKHLESFA